LKEKERQLEQKDASIQEIRNLLQQQQAAMQQQQAIIQQINQRTEVIVDQNTGLSQNVTRLGRDLSVVKHAVLK
jgi:methyl-accepting chemotaxis protein